RICSLVALSRSRKLAMSFLSQMARCGGSRKPYRLTQHSVQRRLFLVVDGSSDAADDRQDVGDLALQHGVGGRVEGGRLGVDGDDTSPSPLGDQRDARDRIDG